MPVKIFGGKKYEHDRRFKLKRDAQKRAKSLRRSGYNTRVSRQNLSMYGRKSKGWATYTKYKSRR
jgi:hypothetical protein